MTVAARPAVVLPLALIAAIAVGVFVAAAGPASLGLVVAVPAAWVGVRLLARATVDPSRLFLPTIAGSLVISQAWVLTGSQGVRVLGVGYLVVVAGLALIQPKQLALRKTSAAVVAVFVLLLAIALARGAHTGANGSLPAAVITTAQFAAVFTITLGYARAAETAADLVKLATAVALAPAVYVAVNLALLAASAFAPIPMPEQISVALGVESSTLAALGINVERVQLPLAQSINNVGVVAAAGLAAGILLALRGGQKVLGATAAAVCLAGVLAADTRTSLIIAFVVAALALLRPRGRWAAPIAVLLPLSPFIVVWVVHRLQDSLGSALSTGGRDFATGSNRFLIWERAIDTAAHPNSFDAFERATTILFGYGAGGHIASTAAYRYEFLFRSQEYRLAHTHNIAIQTFLDSGLVGIAALSAAALVGVIGLGHLVKAVGGATSALLAMFVVLLGGGVTEVVPTYMSPEAMSLMLMALAVAIVRPRA